MLYTILYLLGLFLSFYFYGLHKRKIYKDSQIYCDETSEIENVNTNNKNIVIVATNNSYIKNINIK